MSISHLAGRGGLLNSAVRRHQSPHCHNFLTAQLPQHSAYSNPFMEKIPLISPESSPPTRPLRSRFLSFARSFNFNLFRCFSYHFVSVQKVVSRPLLIRIKIWVLRIWKRVRIVFITILSLPVFPVFGAGSLCFRWINALFSWPFSPQR